MAKIASKNSFWASKVSFDWPRLSSNQLSIQLSPAFHRSYGVRWHVEHGTNPRWPMRNERSELMTGSLYWSCVQVATPCKRLSSHQTKDRCKTVPTGVMLLLYWQYAVWITPYGCIDFSWISDLSCLDKLPGMPFISVGDRFEDAWMFVLIYKCFNTRLTC